MISPMRSFLRPLLLLAACLMSPAAGSAQGEPPWVTGLHSRVQLVPAAPAADAPAHLAGLVIRLDPGFKTYWRHPGESGLPPAFDWSKSKNLEGVEVLWPAPSRLEDGGGVSYGYLDGVVLPLRVTPRDASKPVDLSLKVDYGVCKDICIPAQADLALRLLPKPGAEHAGVREALARVPTPQSLGADGDLSIVAVEPITADGKPMIAVAVRAPAGEKPQLFVEAPNVWFLAPAGAMDPAARGPPHRADGSFLVEIAERPKDAAGPLDLRLTLVAGGRAVETTARLDSARLPR